jgi:quinol monooxygenase YgiN
MRSDGDRAERAGTDVAKMRRRDFLAIGGISATVVATASCAFTTSAAQSVTTEDGAEMYGLIGKMTAAPGKRDELIGILVNATGQMPGCLSYVVAKDATDADAIWITEAWQNKASHDASLSLPQVKESMAKGRPLIASFGDRIVTTPIGGWGLTAHK